MCTYLTVRTPVTASAKGPDSAWFRPREAVVYFDHPAHSTAEHTVNIDLAVPGSATGQRVALELTELSARDLMAAIAQVLSSAPASIR